MKTTLIAVLSTICSLMLTATAFAHGDIEIGPNGGRVIEFGGKSSVIGEVRVVDSKFQVELLDKNKKPVALTTEELTVTGGDRSNPEKLTVEKKGKYFVAPTVKSGQFVIFQLKTAPDAKPATARFKYDTEISDDGKTPNWLHAH